MFLVNFYYIIYVLLSFSGLQVYKVLPQRMCFHLFKARFLNFIFIFHLLLNFLGLQVYESLPQTVCIYLV